MRGIADSGEVAARGLDATVAAALALDDERIVGVALTETDGGRVENGVELARAFHTHMAHVLRAAVPEAECMVEHAAAARTEPETRRELVAVAEIAPVVVAVDLEANRLVVDIPAAREERMDVDEPVAARLDDDAHEHAGNAHVGNCVVVALDEHADGINLARADDVHVPDVAVGRTAIGAMLDAKPDLDMLHRHFGDHRLAPAVDRNAARDATPVDDAALEPIPAARRTNVVRGMDAPEPNHGLGTFPIRRRLEDGKRRKMQRHAPFRMRRRANRLVKQIGAVGEIDLPIGILVDQPLNRVRTRRFPVTDNPDRAQNTLSLNRQSQN